MSSAIQIPNDVLDILAQSRVEGEKLFLPPAQLERKLYERIDKTLRRLGGRWQTKARAHVFDRDVEEIIESAILTGSFVDEKVLHQFFETPHMIAERLVELADLRFGGMTILEPSAGSGALARVVRDALPFGCSLSVCESHQGRREQLRAQGFHLVDALDFLAFTPSIKLDRIIQNPPFAKRQDAAHFIHAYNCLGNAGRLVSVMSASVLFRKEDEYERVREIADEIIELPDGSFKESGANVRAVIVTANKN